MQDACRYNCGRDSFRPNLNQVLTMPGFPADTDLSAAYLLGFIEDPEVLAPRTRTIIRKSEPIRFWTSGLVLIRSAFYGWAWGRI